MADYGDFLSGSGATNGVSDDPTADFLARERAILGDDAALFGNDFAASPPSAAPASITSPLSAQATGISSVVPGVGGALSPSLVGSVPAVVSPLLPSATGTTDLGWGASQASFAPTMSTAYGTAPIGFTNTGLSNTSAPPVVIPEPEPEVIKQWRERFQAQIDDRDASSKAKHEKLLADAKSALERFYADYNDKKERDITRHRESGSGAQFEEVKSKNIWEGVVRQIETTAQPASSNPARDAAKKGTNNPTRGVSTDEKTKAAAAKGRDLSRFKEVLQSLRKDDNAPGTQ